MPKTNPTNALTDAAIQLIKLRGGMARRVNQTGTYRADIKKFVPPPSSGMSDIVACYHGQFLGLEIKKPKEGLRQSQELFKLELEKSGGIFAIITNLDTLITLLDDLDAKRNH